MPPLVLRRPLLAALVALTLLLGAALASPAEAQVTFEPRTDFATGLSYPTGVTQLPDGRVLINEYNAGRIAAFNADGTGRTTFATGLSGPAGLVRLSDGRLLIAEFGSDRVTAFDADGTGRATFASGLSSPHTLTQLADGRVLVNEYSAGRVTAFNADGTGRVTFATGLVGPAGIAQLADGRILVAEYDANRVAAFNADGTGRVTFATGLVGPHGIAQLSDGRILIAQHRSQFVTAFNADGTGQAEFASGLAGPWGVTQFSDGRFLVTESNSGRVSVLVPVNRPPVANADAYTTDQDTPLTVAAPGVLANDTDPDGDALTAVLESGPASGNLALAANGSFTYTPNAGFSGQDQFTYRASDGALASAPATVTITVTPAAPQPIYVTFQVDMSVRWPAVGADHLVGVRGSLAPLSWDRTEVMSDGGGRVYATRVAFDPALAGRRLEYKFIHHAPPADRPSASVSEGYEGNVGPGDFSNRILTLGAPGSETALPLVFFNNHDGSAVDRDPPVCAGALDGRLFRGTVTDGGSGVATVALAGGADNLALTVAAFAPGAASVAFSVALVDGTRDGAGEVVGTDGAGNACRVAVAIAGEAAPPPPPPVDTTPPVCAAITLERGPDGKITALSTGASDPESGIASVTFTTLRNFTGFVSGNGPFTQGQTFTFDTPPPTITLRGERIDMALGGTVLAQVTNGAGLSSMCDPVVAQLASGAEVTALEGAAPNPVGRAGTAFRFTLAEAAHVRLSVYDALGREVGRLADEPMGPGAYSLSWDGQDAFGRLLAPGVYVVRLEAGAFAQSHRLTVVR